MDFGFLLFERPFYFESSDSMEGVVQVLKTLSAQNGFVSLPDELLIHPAADGYSFRYIARRASRGGPMTTAFAEGHIWQERDGVVIVEGAAQIYPWGLYGGLLFFTVFMYFSIGRSSSSAISSLVFMLVSLGWTAFWCFFYFEDRNRLINLIAQALDPMLLDKRFE